MPLLGARNVLVFYRLRNNWMRYLLLFIYLGLLFSSCNTRTKYIENQQTSNDTIIDEHSYANLNAIKTIHLELELDVNFQNKTIYGVARHEMVNNNASVAIFDTRNLLIQKVTTGKIDHEQEADFVIGEMDKDSILGQPLKVTVDPKTTQVNIYYQTTKGSEALDWLDTLSTSSKTKPFLYTQGQAILTRTWIPLQDSPSNRFTYNAEVRVPKDLLALMSAENPKEKNDLGIYNFEMDQPIPSYLISLAVGDIAYHPFDATTGVYAEKELLDACKYEFVDLPKMMKAASYLYGDYQWKQYDLMVLPYSFPFGGMENPRLTFVNPTILAGDRSLVSVIAHELAHSWSGNLVTNNTWDDFWLNEGFTVYFEQRIMEVLYGKETADILAQLEFQEFQEEMKEILTGKHPEDSQLHLNLKGRNPDDGMTTIAYIKGAFFLKTLESKVGREKFDRFLKHYFNVFKFKTVSTAGFIAEMENNLLLPEKLSFDYDEWIFHNGLPKNSVIINSPRLKRMESLAKRFSAGENVFEPVVTYEWQKIKNSKKKKRIKKVSKIKRDDFIVQEWQTFIRGLSDDISIEKLQYLDATLNFSTWGNSEVMAEWFVLNIHRENRIIRPAIEKFISKVGRRKYLLPIYKALVKNPEDKVWAKKVFDNSKAYYHAVSRNSVAELFEN
ncbi:MAG: M1 family metallopeptidase [Crocinitomicaceae bacterium]|nr:M1 family metallopeptidase [Crocinitomicaceae bacterium]